MKNPESRIIPASNNTVNIKKRRVLTANDLFFLGFFTAVFKNHPPGRSCGISISAYNLLRNNYIYISYHQNGFLATKIPILNCQFFACRIISVKFKIKVKIYLYPLTAPTMKLSWIRLLSNT
jgi:hypothetical protein